MHELFNLSLAHSTSCGFHLTIMSIYDDFPELHANSCIEQLIWKFVTGLLESPLKMEQYFNGRTNVAKLSRHGRLS